MRRRILVAYDISDDRRRTKVATAMEAHGDRVQYSVFVCRLTGRELAMLRGQLRDAIDHREDQVIFVDLGEDDGASGPEGIRTIGRPYAPIVRATVI